MKQIILIMTMLMLMFTQTALADIPGTINYQGRLTDAAGNPVADGTYGVTFKLYYEATGDTPTGWSEVQNVSTKNGYFSVALGSQNPLSKLCFDRPYYLETWVGGDSQPMSPRQPLQSVPYALNAGMPVGAIIAWHKTLYNSLPSNWVECNGGTVSDPESPIYGQPIPNLNGEGRFLRGSTVSGTMQEDAFQGHKHKDLYVDTTKMGWYFTDAGAGAATFVITMPDTVNVLSVGNPSDDGTNGTPRTASETRPKNMSVVWIMKIK